MKFDEEKFWHEVEIAPAPFTKGEKDELAHLLSYSLLRKALAHAMQVMQAGEANWLGIDMSTPEGVSRAVQLQGEVKGMLRVIQTLVDLTKEEEEDGT
jgi:hypothetical protein